MTYEEEHELLLRLSTLEAEMNLALNTIDALEAKLYQQDRTVVGIQQMLGKAAEYKGREKGRLPRDRKKVDDERT